MNKFQARGAVVLWRRGSAVRRFHTMDTIVTDTVGKHSGGVAYLCMLIMGDLISKSLVMAALQHDLPEFELGDIPSPTKKLMGCFTDAEDNIFRDHGVEQPILDELETNVLTYADAADGLLYCGEEVARGNKNLAKIGDKYLEYLLERESKCAEAPNIWAVNIAVVNHYKGITNV